MASTFSCIATQTPRGCTVSIVTTLQVDDRGSTPGKADRLWGPHDILSNGYWVFSSGEKRPERDANHSPHLVARLRMRGAISQLPHTSAWCGAQLHTGYNFSVTTRINYEEKLAVSEH
jgi:hypothetical protein